MLETNTADLFLKTHTYTHTHLGLLLLDTQWFGPIMKIVYEVGQYN